MFVARIGNRNSKPANLTKWPPERITAMERLCRGEFDGWTGGEVTSGEAFGVTEVVMVGDRGMIKGKAALSAAGLRYITALTDAQVRTLLRQTPDRAPQ